MGKHTQKRSHISAPANTLASRRSCSYLGNCTCLGLCLSWRLGTGFGFGPHRCVASLGWLRRLRHKGPGANKEHQKHSIKKLKHDNIFFFFFYCILKNWLEVLSFKFLAWTSLPTPRNLLPWAGWQKSSMGFYYWVYWWKDPFHWVKPGFQATVVQSPTFLSTKLPTLGHHFPTESK